MHELAKELGATSKDILSWLNQNGERVKSASSTVEAPVARRVREAFSGSDAVSVSKQIRRVSGVDTSKKVPEVPVSKERKAPVPRTVYITAPDLIHRARERKLSGRYPSAPDTESSTARQQKGVEQAFVRKVRKASILRVREGGLPPLAAEDLTVLANAVVAGTFPRRCIDDVSADLACFGPKQEGEYGYLAWRYSTVRRLTEDASDPSGDRTPSAHHIEIVADVVGNAKRLIDQLVGESRRKLFTDGAWAEKTMHAEFEKLLVPQRAPTRTTSEEVRSIRAKSRFLRRAFVMTIAHPDQAGELWEMLGSLRPTPNESQPQSIPPVEAAAARLNDEISSVALILSVSDDSFLQFCAKSSEELKRLRSGDFDYLAQFGEGIPWKPATERQGADLLSFTVLEPGEQLRDFLRSLRSTRRYRGYDVDLRRLKVLEDLQNRYGAAQCRWAEGASSNGVNNQYLVLAIPQAGGEGYEHALAVSPLAGQHATFVVRGDCCDLEWTTIFANTKTAAIRLGARRLVFRGENPYDAMLAKVVTLLECPAAEFISRR